MVDRATNFTVLCPVADTTARATALAPLCFYRPLRFFIYAITKCSFRRPVGQKPVSPWRPSCAPLVGGRTYVSMKLIGPAGTELRHILAICIMCSCDDL